MSVRKRTISKAAIAALAAACLSLIQSPAQAAPGESDTTLVTDGTARYAKIASNSAIGTFNAISIEFWFKSSLASCDGNIVSKGVDYAVYCAAGTMNYAFKGGGTVTGTTVRFAGTSGPTSLTPPQNEWHHFAITRAANATTVTTYWDGQVVSSDQTSDGAGSTALANTGEDLNIGARRNGATYFNGLIDEVRISNVVRTQAEIQADMKTWGIGSETGVVAYYDFNDVSGTTVVDRVGSNNLTLVGSPTISSVESTSTIGNDTVVVFPRSYLTSQGGWRVPGGITKIESLVVGGGGAGGSRAGGGGGAGGYVYTDRNTLTYTAGAVEAITVGAGGVGQNDTKGSNGQNSSIGTRRIALGGGGGGSANGANNTLRNGADGGSGGGAAVGYSSTTATAGSTIQNSTYSYGLGFNGAQGLGANYFQGGGGGGASSAAIIAAGYTYNDWSDGGNGVTNSITGSSVCYATGGGGGYGLNNAGAASLRSHGGNCGGVADPNGGQGAYGKLKGQWATANSGGGGGAGGFDDTTTGNDKPGGSGGSGIIVLRYSTLLTATLNGVASATYRSTSTMTATTSIGAKVTFFANGKRIAGCISLPTVNLVATCNWKPAFRGSINVTATATSLLSNPTSVTLSASTFVGKRTNNR